MNEIKNFNFNEITEAVDRAEALIRPEQYKTRMARFLRGRLRGVDSSVLIALKRELKDFNAHTGEWK